MRSARLFSDYLGKTRAGEQAMATTSDCSCLAMPMSHDEFLVAVGRSIVQHSGLDGRVHLKTRFDGRRRWHLHVRCHRKKLHVRYLIPGEFFSYNYDIEFDQNHRKATAAPNGVVAQIDAFSVCLKVFSDRQTVVTQD